MLVVHVISGWMSRTGIETAGCYLKNRGEVARILRRGGNFAVLPYLREGNGKEACEQGYIGPGLVHWAGFVNRLHITALIRGEDQRGPGRNAEIVGLLRVVMTRYTHMSDDGTK